MRRGRVVLSRAQDRAAPLSADELTRAIMGGEPPPPFAPPQLAEDAAAVLEIEGLTLGVVDGGAGGRACSTASTSTVRAGEIVGVAGVEGNGQRELVRALAGLEPRAAGRVAVAGEDSRAAGVRARRPLDRRGARGSPRGGPPARRHRGRQPRARRPRRRAAASTRRRRSRGGSSASACGRGRGAPRGRALGRQPAEDRDRAGPRPAARRRARRRRRSSRSRRAGSTSARRP